MVSRCVTSRPVHRATICSIHLWKSATQSGFDVMMRLARSVTRSVPSHASRLSSHSSAGFQSVMSVEWTKRSSVSSVSAIPSFAASKISVLRASRVSSW